MSTIEGGMVCTNNKKFMKWQGFSGPGMARESKNSNLKIK